jgi:hypothetical protein
VSYRDKELDRQVRDYDEQIAKLRDYIAGLEPVLVREQQKLADLDERYRTVAMSDADYGWQRQLLLDNIKTIEQNTHNVHTNVFSRDGVATGAPEIVALMVGKPGLRDAERTLERLLAERNTLDQKANVDPEAKVRARLVQGNFYTNGRRILPGEIVELNNRQLQNWSDLFEPVS